VPPAALAAFTLLLWSRTAGLPLHYWDDSVYLFNDPRLNAPSLANIWAILTKPFFANYHPVTTYTFLWDRLIWKTWLPGFHFTHLWFYAGGVVLAYFFFLSIVRNRFWALLGAALFSSHALHVEPVAWLASRKDVVCLFFSTASLCLYVRYAQVRDGSIGDSRKLWLGYLTMLVTFSLALGSKGYAAVLPLIFIAYDACCCGRFRWRLVFDKLPLFALALGLTIATILAQDETSALIKNSDLTFQLGVLDRLALLLKIFCLYVGRSLLPVHLSATYLVSNEGWMPGWVALLGLLLLSALVYGFFMLRKASPALAMGFALFVLPLFTTLNTFFTLRIWMADRYTLFSTLGSTLVVAGLGAWLSERIDRKNGDRQLFRSTGCPLQKSVESDIGACPHFFVTAAALLVLIHSGLAFSRMGIWSSASLLHSDAIRRNFPILSGNGIVTAEEIKTKTEGRQVPSTLLELLERLSIALQHEGKTEQSRKVTELLEDFGYSGLGIGVAELKRGNLDKAIDCFKAEITRGEWYAGKAAKLLGDTYSRKGQPEQARQWYQQSISFYQKQRQSPREARLGEGNLEFSLKNLPRALEIFQLMTQENPGDPLGPFCVGRILEAMGEMSEAYKQYEQVAAMPVASFKDRFLNLADVYQQMGVLAQKMNNYPAAIHHFEQYLLLNPDDPQRTEIEQTLKMLRENRR
jgi:tetratricopeptide (TPR) repeat protein